MRRRVNSQWLKNCRDGSNTKVSQPFEVTLGLKAENHHQGWRLVAQGFLDLQETANFCWAPEPDGTTPSHHFFNAIWLGSLVSEAFLRGLTLTFVELKDEKQGVLRQVGMLVPPRCWTFASCAAGLPRFRSAVRSFVPQKAWTWIERRTAFVAVGAEEGSFEAGHKTNQHRPPALHHSCFSTFAPSFEHSRG